MMDHSGTSFEKTYEAKTAWLRVERELDTKARAFKGR